MNNKPNSNEVIQNLAIKLANLEIENSMLTAKLNELSKGDEKNDK